MGCGQFWMCSSNYHSPAQVWLTLPRCVCEAMCLSACACLCTCVLFVFPRSPRKCRSSFPSCAKQKQLLQLIKRAKLRPLLLNVSFHIISLTLFFRRRGNRAGQDFAVWASVWASGCRIDASTGEGADKATLPRRVRLTAGHRGCLALWLTDVSLTQQQLWFWKKLHHTLFHIAVIFSV